MGNDVLADSSGSLELSLSESELAAEEDAATQADDDNWIEELECALLADCDPSILRKICEGKRVPTSLRPDYWRTLLSLNEEGKVKLTGEYDLPNQAEIRQDCERLVDELATTTDESLSEAERLRLRSDFESTLTTYVKARPELEYICDNGWTDILKVLHNLKLSDSEMYQMFFRIVDRYIPKGLSQRNSEQQSIGDSKPKPASTTTTSSPAIYKQKSNLSPKKKPTNNILIESVSQGRDDEKSGQAYHLLRLLIQYHDPELCSMLDSRKATPNLYVRDWFCSLFARSCSPPLALQIWDMHFRMADPFLIFFAAIVMVVNASDQLKRTNLSQTEIVDILKKMPGQLEEDDIEDLYYLVSNHYTNSTPRSIRSYSHLFFMDTFGSTYSGNESPEESPPLMDLRTTKLTSSLDLSQYLCLPIVPAEIFALDTAQQRSSPTNSAQQQLRYFLVDCRPAEQYNAGHLTKAFHLDCSLMLREPSSFATAVQALLEIQRQVVESKSNTGGQHLCFIGSGQEEEDQYVNMVVASFLQKNLKYVSIVFGGFEAIHDYVKTKSELKDSFGKLIVDHNEELCKACYSKLPIEYRQAAKHRLAAQQNSHQSGSGNSASFGSAQSLFATTTSFFKGDKMVAGLSASSLSKLTSNPQASNAANLLAQSGASMFDKFATAFVSKSNVIKDRLVETLNTTNLPASATLSGGSGSARSHVSSHDKLGRRYTGSSTQGLLDDLGQSSRAADDSGTADEPCQEVQLDVWQKEQRVIALYKCAQIKGVARHPGFLALTRTHLWILREIPHNKGFASIAAKRPLDMIVQITSKRRQPDFIIFRYGYASNTKVGNKAESDSETSTQSGGIGATEQTQTIDEPQAKVVQPIKSLPTIIASDHLHIPEAFEVIRLIKREVVRIMDESLKKSQAAATCVEPSGDDQQRVAQVSVDKDVPKDADDAKQSNESAADKKETIKITSEKLAATTEIVESTSAEGEQSVAAVESGAKLEQQQH